jgi:uncharacterized membrane protein
MKKILLTIGILTITALLNSQIALADHHNEEINYSGFTIYPSYMHDNNTNWITLDTEQGAEIKDYVTVENLSAEKQTINLEIKNADNTGSSFTISESENGLTAWINLQNSTVTLEPYESKKIPFEMKIPKNAEVKNYTGAILAAKTTANPDSLNIVTKIGVRMFINVTEPKPVQANIFTSRTFANSIFYFLSLFAVLASIFYTLINYLDQRKYEKKHA